MASPLLLALSTSALGLPPLSVPCLICWCGYMQVSRQWWYSLLELQGADMTNKDLKL